jgi:DNA-binding transcriptional MerR regulator
MRNSDIAKQGLMRISEVAKATGVSLPTIHYYTREGLVFPSLKTAHNMAYYSQDSVKDIQLIKDLQSKKFLPLSVIKLILRARREGQDMDHVVEMESVLHDVFRPVADEAKSRSITLHELVAASGLPETEIKFLEAKGLIVSKETENGFTYDDIDVRIAQIFKRLAELGLKPRNLDIYRQYMAIVRNEFKTMHDTIHQLPNHDIIPLQELFKIADDLKKYLALRIYREEAQHSHEYSSLQGENK